MNLQIKGFLRKRFERKIFTGLPLTIFTLIFFVLFGTFLGITDSILNSKSIVNIDNSFSEYIFGFRTAGMAELFYVITDFGGQPFILSSAVLFLLYLLFKKEIVYLYAFLLSFIGAEGSIYFLKILINRARPLEDIAFYLEHSKSFPSGHAGAAMAFYGFLTYYLFSEVAKSSNKKIGVLLLGIIVIILVGLSRLYLGVHFLSDVLGGFIIGGLWILLGIIFRERHLYLDSLRKNISN